LPGGVATTNLSVALAGSGLGVSPQAEVSLEWQGTLLRRLTSGVPASVLLTNLSAGKYFLTAHGLGTPMVANDVSFDIRPAALHPPNDSWQQAEPIPDFNVVMIETNLHATREIGEPATFGNASGRTVWWSWQAETSGSVTATTIGSSFDTTLAVFGGTQISNLTLVASNDEAGADRSHFSQVTFGSVAGTRYWLAVDGALAADGVATAGVVQLRLVPGTPPVLAVASPADGAGIVVPNASFTTNLPLVVNVSEPVARVECWVDGSAPGARQVELLPPYQATLTNLPPGDYVLTVGASNAVGLIRCVDVRFSVRPLAPEIRLTDGPMSVAPSLPLAVTGLKGSKYTLERSDDLAAWSPVVAWTNFPGAEKVMMERSPAASGRFYRGMLP